jgi:hypothetical protein
MFSKLMVLGVAVALSAGVASANAQGCSGTGSCNVNATATLSIPVLVDLDIAGTGNITLTSPTATDLGVGYVQDAAPSIAVKANRAWRLQLHTTEATNWIYSGSEGGVKPISDLRWSTTSNGTYTAITTTATDIGSGGRTNSGAPTLFFRTLYTADFADNANAAGSYSIPLVFTLIAP